MATVIFDPEQFRKNHPNITPELITDDQLQMFFDIAVQFVGDTDANSWAEYDPENKKLLRAQLLDLAVCHIATLTLWPSGQAGRIASATQGSISTSFDLFKANSSLEDYWLQTPCGRLFWMLSASRRLGGVIVTNDQYHPWG